jgi:leucyl-tRNA synthetase
MSVHPIGGHNGPMSGERWHRPLQEGVPMDMEQAWELADLWWRSNALSTFVAAYTNDADRAREARQLCDQLFGADSVDLAAAEDIVSTLDGWAWELADQVPAPAEPRPDEADRQVRDYVKDVSRDRVPRELREWAERTQSFLDFIFKALIRGQALPAWVREDVRYVYGRATMAIDLGHRAAAERELERLRRYEITFAEQAR